MATSMVVSCPKCKKRYQAPSECVGRKLRCKDCGAVFKVEEETPPEEKPKKKAVKLGSAEDEVYRGPSIDDPADLTPFALTETSFIPRCPNCAHELEEEGAIVCLNCGFNSQTRQFLGTKYTIATTAQDRMNWLLPGVMHIFVVLLTLGFVFCLWVTLPAVARRNPNEWWIIFDHAMTKVWGTVFSLFVVYISGRSAIHRLILHPEPPENIVQ